MTLIVLLKIQQNMCIQVSSPTIDFGFVYRPRGANKRIRRFFNESCRKFTKLKNVCTCESLIYTSSRCIIILWTK